MERGFGALGLRAVAECAAVAAAKRDRPGLAAARGRAQVMLALSRQAAQAATVTREAGAWQALAEAEYGRIAERPQPDR